MKALPALRKNKKKGFTLVEIIVVLVIIAIMMAALAPVMIGWINDARETTVRTEGRLFLMAAQTTITEAVATNLWEDGSTYDMTPDAAGLPILKADSKFIRLVTDSALATLTGNSPAAYSDLVSIYLDTSGIPCGVVVENPVRNRNAANRITIGRTTTSIVGEQNP
jgi:prepilin-type N-terminal cleavage/methylation domain-containing protein